MPSWSSYALAAMADAAVRGLEPVRAKPAAPTAPEVDTAVVEDDMGRQWLVRAPRTPAAGVRLEREAGLLRVLAGKLPFEVPKVAGTAMLKGGGRAVVCELVRGTPLQPSTLTPGPGLAASLGRSLAAVHDLPVQVAEEAGLAVYGVEEYRQRRMAEVDRAAGTGLVPTALLARWESALEEAGAWRFAPCFLHGDLAAETVLTERGKVSGILDWADARVADPADDLAWLAIGAEEHAYESVIEAYVVGRREQPDRHLARRARLAGELAVARWLLPGVAAADDDVIRDAERMLSDLDLALADTPW